MPLSTGHDGIDRICPLTHEFSVTQAKESQARGTRLLQYNGARGFYKRPW